METQLLTQNQLLLLICNLHRSNEKHIENVWFVIRFGKLKKLNNL